MIQVGNAPCSWGTLEFTETQGQQVEYRQMLDELVATGYTGTELGDWGYMPTDPEVLREELSKRSLTMLGAFVPVALRDPDRHAAGEQTAVKTARLIAAVAGDHRPFLVLSDDNAADPLRTRNAGRIKSEMSLAEQEWQVFAAGAERIARAVKEQSGLATVFHPHCAGYIETPEEIDQLLSRTDPQLLGLVFDTGHYVYGTGESEVDLQQALDRYKERLWYVHFKDCHPGIVARARDEGWDYFEAVKNGVFCELGQGNIDFAATLEWLRQNDYHGWILVEQDVLPGMGTPRESARRNREYLTSIGL